MELKRFLKEKYNWSDRELINRLDLKQIFKKANYHASSELLGFISHFYNMHILFLHCDVNFKIKKVLSDYPYSLFFDQFCELTGKSNPTPFAEIKGGHMVLVVDEDNFIYGIFDDCIVEFGDNYYDMLKKLYLM